MPNSGQVNRERLAARHAAMAKIGATGRGGVRRLALSDDDTAARLQLVGWAKERGFKAAVDPIGNLFIRRRGRVPDMMPVVTGSHLDSQPTGGNYDGVFGVLAAFEAMESLEDRGIATRRPIDLVVWTNEEGARFAPTTMGSGVFARTLALDDILTVSDSDGVTVAQALGGALAALANAAAIEKRPLGAPAFAYVEAHIEQGPVLEASNTSIGVVTGIQGLRQFEVTVSGAEGHAGTTPLHRRRDALVGARKLLDAIEANFPDDAEDLRFTVGRLEVKPGAVNTIPGEVVFTIDLRHPDAGAIEKMTDGIAAACRSSVAPCSAKMRLVLDSEPTAFDPALVSRIAEACDRLGFTRRTMMSGATHDAKHMAALCPTGMIFIPCRDGVSHNEAESAELGHIVAGAHVLADVVLSLAEK